MENQLYFFFSGLGVFNGALMGLYFLLNKNDNPLPNRLFGLLLLSLSLRIGKSIFHFYSSLSKDVLQLGLTACLFIGLFLFLYIKVSLEERQKLLTKEKGQLVAAIVISLFLFIFLPYREFPQEWNKYVVKVFYNIWLVYIILSGIQLRGVIQKLIKARSSKSVLEKWLLTVFFINILIWLVFNSVLYFGYPSYIFGPLTFSFTFYLLALFLLFHPERNVIFFGEATRYQNKKISSSKVQEIEKGLKSLIEEKHIYKKPDLKLSQVASALEVSPHLLSQYLNDNLSKTFKEFINSYRIEAACQIIAADHQYTLEGIGNEVGFRSKSNFYATFKKHKGCTPKQYENTIEKS